MELQNSVKNKGLLPDPEPSDMFPESGFGFIYCYRLVGNLTNRAVKSKFNTIKVNMKKE